MKQRVVTSLLLAPSILLVSIINSPYPFFGVCFLSVTLAFWELRVMLNTPRVIPILTLVSVVIPFYGIQVQHLRDPIQICLYANIFFVVGVISAWLASTKQLKSGSVTDLSGLWISMPIVILMMVHQLTENSSSSFNLRTILLLFFLPVWLGDIAGLFFGKRFGKRPLWKDISPSKTVEGSIANLVVSVLCALALYPVIHTRTTFLIPWWIFGLIGVASSVFGQAGDLFESYLKRRNGLKDSGNLLPGHGGLLDRIDSLLFSVPALSLILIFLLRGHS